MKKLLITIDTEGDNLWAWKSGDEITTKNVLHLQKFQDLCNEFGFKPSWLTNYEMISDSKYLDFISDVEEKGMGELGMHLHAWNNPPEYKLDQTGDGAPYLIEYPTEIMEKKIAFLDGLIVSRTGIKATSHRAGRWAMDDRYFKLLAKYSYTVDCSVTPGVSWKHSEGATLGVVGTDYTDFPKQPYWVKETDKKLLEIPVSIRKSHKVCKPEIVSLRNIKRMLVGTVRGNMLWLRPQGQNLSQMMHLIDICSVSEEDDYIMFMLHSSELMAGGSPAFTSERDIEKLYQDLKILFKKLSESYQGCTLREYYDYYTVRKK